MKCRFPQSPLPAPFRLVIRDLRNFSPRSSFKAVSGYIFPMTRLHSPSRPGSWPSVGLSPQGVAVTSAITLHLLAFGSQSQGHLLSMALLTAPLSSCPMSASSVALHTSCDVWVCHWVSSCLVPPPLEHRAWLFLSTGRAGGRSMEGSKAGPLSLLLPSWPGRLVRRHCFSVSQDDVCHWSQCRGRNLEEEGVWADVGSGWEAET